MRYFKPEDFAGITWTDSSNDIHYITEGDADIIAGLSNDKLEPLLATLRGLLTLWNDPFFYDHVKSTLHEILKEET